jgi:thiol-disulfide isomerase/thioredoxin
MMIALTTAINTVNGQGINFEHTEWSQVLKKAETSNRYVFVDFYASWCGPCKYMSREVFTNEAAGKFFNANFVSYKVDAENEEEELVESVDLTAYPTLAFFDSQGNLVYRHVGSMDENELVALGEKLKRYKSARSAVLRSQATREQVLEYLSIAKIADSVNYKKMAPALAKTITVAEFSNPDAWELFKAYTHDINDARFQFMVGNVKMLHEKHEGFAEYMDGVLGEYFFKMAEKGNLAGLDIYKKSMQKIFNQLDEEQRPYSYYDLKVNVQYYLHREEMDKYASILTTWVNGYLTDDWKLLSENAVELSKNVKDRKHFESALAWAKKAVELDRGKLTLYNLAVVYQNGGDKNNALKYAQQVLTCELDDEEKEFVQDYINELKS